MSRLVNFIFEHLAAEQALEAVFSHHMLPKLLVTLTLSKAETAPGNLVMIFRLLVSNQRDELVT